MMAYDVVIIGGGIHGVGIAKAVAEKNRSCLLLEKKEIASGTSGKSSKLIHGGLRYLETGEFNLVRECLLEREYLLKTEADLVKLSPVFLPVYESSQ
ncbi:MAG: FAD-dependent oxidoreductase, partial [Nitrospinae bacterium]|nr:FAD-dependent oxidoreductase [Nitrospinota bacterium]